MRYDQRGVETKKPTTRSAPTETTTETSARKAKTVAKRTSTLTAVVLLFDDFVVMH
jgi:predicted house-cleaning NTP pyrophosphatase (Maf/HAM1 superfamily)